MSDLTLEEFLDRFPEFSDKNEYPLSKIEYRLKMAVKFCSNIPFYDEDTKKHVQGLHVAHFLAAGGPASASGSGAAPGAGSLGVVTGKSVDGASVSYDSTTAAEEGAGFWNATAYGREFWQLMQMFGAGGIQL